MRLDNKLFEIWANQKIVAAEQQRWMKHSVNQGQCSVTQAMMKTFLSHLNDHDIDYYFEYKGGLDSGKV